MTESAFPVCDELIRVIVIPTVDQIGKLQRDRSGRSNSFASGLRIVAARWLSLTRAPNPPRRAMGKGAESYDCTRPIPSESRLGKAEGGRRKAEVKTRPAPADLHPSCRAGARAVERKTVEQ